MSGQPDESSSLRSALSGTALEGSTTPAQIKITFPDGDERNLTISAAEAADLKRTGTPASAPPGWLDRAWPRIKANGWKAFTVALAAYFASVVIPAVVQQWADRQKELEFKNTLVTGISDLVADTAVNGRNLRLDTIAERGALDDATADLASTRKEVLLPSSDGGVTKTAGETQEVADAVKAVKSARAEWTKASRTLFYTTRNNLTKTGASIESRLDTYFVGSGLPQAWAEYRSVLRDQLELLTTGLEQNEKERRPYEERVLRYVCSGLDEMVPENGYLTKSCEALANHTKIPTGRYFPFVPAANELLRRRVGVLEEIRDANADGYSTGPNDLIRAVVPFYD